MRASHETPEEGRRTHRPKRSEYKNEDEDNNPNILREFVMKLYLENLEK